MKCAYADPPYYGSCGRYGHRHEKPWGCWDDLDTHRALIEHLADYDGWALSCTTNSLRYLLPMCPPGVRVLAWVKRHAIWKKGVNPAYSWEPVIVQHARRLPGPESAGSQRMVQDWHECGYVQKGLAGQKPLEFCRWVFTCMGADRDDTLEDIFHGSGAVKVAWEHYLRHLTLFDGDRPRQEVLVTDNPHYEQDK